MGFQNLIACLLIFSGIISFPGTFSKKIITKQPSSSSAGDTLLYPDEKHLQHIRQLTFGGDNAEAYFSYDGKYLIFQRKDEKENVFCDQMYIGKIPTSPDEKFEPKMISSGKGRTTCGFFTKDGKHVIYASTYLGGDSCPPVPDRQKLKRYIWPVYDSYDIFMA
ncbi:MAG: hypothetical protein ABUT20_61070, partial [Bacteroidota bacterium]